jgi:hypothetical protein
MGESPLTVREFLAHIEPMRSRLDEVVELQQKANGRTGALEGRVAVLEDRVPAPFEPRIRVLEDRSPGRVGMIAGGGVAGALYVLVWLLQHAGK